MKSRAHRHDRHNEESTLISPRPARGDFAIAFVAGVLGALAMSILMGIGLFMMQWSPYSLELLLGNIITGKISATTWVVGFAWHLLNGGLFALVYASIFKYIKHAGPSTGALISIGHWAIASLLLNFLGDLFIPSALGRMTIVGSLLLHLTYGAIVGSLYRAAMQRRPAKVLSGELEPEPRWRKSA